MCEPDLSSDYWLDVDYDKHWPHYHLTWDQSRDGSVNGPARYHPSLTRLDIRTLEMSYADKDKGKWLLGTGYWIVVDETRKVVGAYCGKDTNIILVKRSAQGAIHGHPISDLDCQKYIKKYGIQQ
jgi:hypothetical protein